MGNPLTVDYAPGTQIPLALFQGVPLNVIVGTPGGVVDASSVTYTPADPLDWPIPPPSDVATALDLLAAVNGSFAENIAPIAPATASNLVTITALQPQKSGIYLAWGSAQYDGNGSTSGIALLDLAVDAVVQGQPAGVGYTVGAWTLGLSTFRLIAVNRALPHTWALLGASGSATPFSVQAQRARLMLLEL
jgi:hypothetical protein